MKRACLFVAVFLLLLSAAPFALAQGLVPCGYDIDGDGIYDAKTEGCQFCHIFLLVDRILDFILFTFVPAVAVLMVVVGGAYFLFSQGSPANIQRGRDILKSVMFGLLIVYASWLVINLFFVAIGVQEWTGLGGGIFSIPCAPR
ncbi:MAG: hypothetical protein HY458_01850 [Parcubacteria group bacterium]|nr:hypothetical protein [Parcubacteria group bacterium]